MDEQSQGGGNTRTQKTRTPNMLGNRCAGHFRRVGLVSCGDAAAYPGSRADRQPKVQQAERFRTTCRLAGARPIAVCLQCLLYSCACALASPPVSSALPAAGLHPGAKEKPSEQVTGAHSTACLAAAGPTIDADTSISTNQRSRPWVSSAPAMSSRRRPGNGIPATLPQSANETNAPPTPALTI